VEFRFSKLNCLAITLSPAAAVDVLAQFIKRVGAGNQGIYSGEVAVLDGSTWNSFDLPPFVELAQAARAAGIVLAGGRHWPESMHDAMHKAGLTPLDSTGSDDAPESGPNSDASPSQEPAAGQENNRSGVPASSVNPASAHDAGADRSGTDAGTAGASGRDSLDAAPVVAHAAAATTLLIDQPVRSGQKIYARGCDAVIMASVNAGAEIIADGNIHVYGALRGRALAGASGNLKARIIATNFEPELVAIAGYYLTFENGFPGDSKNSPVKIHLEEQAKHLKIDPLNIR
jgi:septum site-determining protein MinC